MEIKLLKDGYKKEPLFYQDFLEDKLWEKNYFSTESVYVDDMPDFPIYFGKANKNDDEFIELIKVMGEKFITLNREIYLDELFWHSYLCLYKREYLLNKYPQIKNSEDIFRNIVIKKFDWENYIYKSILAAQYINDSNSDNKEKYYSLIVNNLDIFNYIIKYEIFRNGNFLINILDIIEKNNLSKILKAKIKGRTDLGNDERYGRRVIFEFNKSYPIILSPMLEKDELEKYFMEYLSYYYTGGDNIDEEVDEWGETE